jgi:hypothetical protein
MTIDNRVDNKQTSQGSLDKAPYLAKIVSHIDPQFQGGIEVSLIRESGNQLADETQTYTVKYASPFYGSTAYEFMGKNVTHDDSQKSYGFWGVPPDVGVTGIVMFIDGKPDAGFWVACVQDKFINHMIPAIGASKNYKAGVDYDQAEHPLPVSEHNRKANEQDKSLEVDKIPRGVHPIASRFKEQGLIRDEFRGPSTSTVRRDIPNMVFGMSSPGPLDRAGKKSFIGNKQSPALVPVSRLGGTQFVMDDGDDRYFRQQNAASGPPNYIKDGGDFGLPYNEHFRIRTRTGHQILLHNTEDLIYIGNSKGTTWIELTSDGKIDIFANDSVSVRTKNDFNFYADRDFNIEVGRNFNVKVRGERHTHIQQDDILMVDKNQKILVQGDVDITNNSTFQHHVVSSVDIMFDQTYKHTVASDVNLRFNANFSQTITGNSNLVTNGNLLDTVKGNLNVYAGGYIYHTSAGANHTKAGGNIIETAPQIHMNGPGASSAAVAAEASTAAVAEVPKVLKVHSLPGIVSPSAKDEPVDLVSILRRIPTAESYPHHENLDPQKFKPGNTDRDSQGRYEGQSSDLRTPPTEWKKYKKPGDNPF